jgi:GNAT superfamily N-acetyltransferase
MARHVCTLDDRPLPAADDPEVVAFLPDSPEAAVLAVDERARPLGAVWWVLREPPLLLDREGSPLPELAIAVVEDERGKGIGRALLDALLERARGQFPALALNVHLLNPAVRPLHPGRFQGGGGRTRVVRRRHESATRPIASFRSGDGRERWPSRLS